jgi:hypothetical protein
MVDSDVAHLRAHLGETPWDWEARRALADALQEQGDPTWEGHLAIAVNEICPHLDGDGWYLWNIRTFRDLGHRTARATGLPWRPDSSEQSFVCHYWMRAAWPTSGWGWADHDAAVLTDELAAGFLKLKAKRRRAILKGRH